jgi:hypothetical protein
MGLREMDCEDVKQIQLAPGQVTVVLLAERLMVSQGLH